MGLIGVFQDWRSRRAWREALISKGFLQSLEDAKKGGPIVLNVGTDGDIGSIELGDSGLHESLEASSSQIAVAVASDVGHQMRLLKHLNNMAICHNASVGINNVNRWGVSAFDFSSNTKDNIEPIGLSRVVDLLDEYKTISGEGLVVNINGSAFEREEDLLRKMEDAGIKVVIEDPRTFRKRFLDEHRKQAVRPS